MFGYVRPLKDELKVREFEQFKACYCALCHTLKSRYGAFARNILNYDFIFLSMLLWEKEETPQYTYERCVASPLKKKTVCTQTKVLDTCAGYSVILAYWKLRDSVADDGFFKSLRDRILSWLLRRAYRKATVQFPDFADTVERNLESLRRLESSGCASLDETADLFAQITRVLAPAPAADASNRPLQQLMYHTGRYIYLLDAFDDLESDMKEGRYNPLTSRFALTAGKLNDTDLELLRTTILHSCGLIGTSFELLPENPWSSILRNIIYLGMPEICLQVLDGTWKSRHGAKTKGMGKL